MQKPFKYLIAALSLSLALVACKKKNEEVEPEQDLPLQGKTTFVVTATPVGTTGIADYLLTTPELSQGTITTLGNGTEQDGTWRYYITHKGKFFSLLYGQGNPGAVTTYKINAEGKLVKSSNFQTETVQVFTSVNDDLLLIKVPRTGDANALALRIDANIAEIVDRKQIDIVKLAGNGERAHFTWARQVGNKIFAPYQSIKGCCSETFNTSFPDSSWIAVFSYPDLQLEKVIKDNRTGFIGSYFNDGLAIDEKGDVYAFSPGFVVSSTTPTLTTRPSAFKRIKAGTTEYDTTYFFNVQKISGGYHISRQTYLKNGKVLLYMYGDKNAPSGGVKLAIADLYAKTFTWISGLPSSIHSHSSSYNNNTLTKDGNTIYIGINDAAESRVYAINISAATASPGLKVEGGKITSLVKVDY